MFFDDRLATVLRQRASSDVGLRTQYRQLLDILGAERTAGIFSSASNGAADGGPGTGADEGNRGDPSLIASAWLRMDALAEKIPANARARMIREPGWRFRNPELATHLADFEPDVASAALNRAQLSAEDWSALIPRLPVRARGFLRLRRDLPVDVETLLERLGVHDRGLPSPDAPIDALLDSALDGTGTGIGATPQIEETAHPAAIVPPSRVQRPATHKPPADFEVDAPQTSPAATSPASAPINEDAAPPHDIAEPLETVPAPKAETTQPSRSPFDPGSEGRSEISALVERIAQFKRTRESGAELDGSEPRLPLGEDQMRNVRLVSAFGFAADAGGRIEWADGEVAAMVIGTRLVAPPRLGSANRETPLERSFIRRQPISGANAQLFGAEAIAGDWTVDAQPRFTDDGNFAGYVGRFRRPASNDPAAPSAAAKEADRIRQLLHELRTPVTAVQGYAEVIQQQLFGSAPHEYRALAAAIAADAARILAGFEELDRLARLETGAIETEPGETDLAALVRRTNRQLEQVLHPRMAGISLDTDDTPYIVTLSMDCAEALLWRLLATLGGGCSAGEMLQATITGTLTGTGGSATGATIGGAGAGMAQLVCDLPAQLLAEEDIFTAEVKPVGTAINAGLFGAGFALRLARAEARAAGGGLVRDDERIVLTLPLLDTDSDAETDCEAWADS